MGGSRGGTSSPFSVRAMATDALSVTAAVFGRRSRVHLLGVSMGGMIAQTMCHLVLSSRAQHTARHRGDHHSQHGKTSEHGRADRRDDDDGHHAAAVVPPVSIASAVFGCTMRGGNTDRLSLLSSSSEFFKIMATPPVFPHGATATSTWLPPPPPLPSLPVSNAVATHKALPGCWWTVTLGADGAAVHVEASSNAIDADAYQRCSRCWHWLMAESVAGNRRTGLVICSVEHTVCLFSLPVSQSPSKSSTPTSPRSCPGI